MSSMLRLSHVNVVNVTIGSLKSPGIGNLFCKDCLERRLIVPQRKYYSMYESIHRILQGTKKKLKKNKYAELVKVSENKAINEKIKFGKLNASHVEAFAEQPGLVLGSLQNQQNGNLTQKSNQELNDSAVPGNNRSSAELSEENDCDTFGTLSNFNKSEKKNFSASNYSSGKDRNEENHADVFGTLSDNVSHKFNNKTYSNFKQPRVDKAEGVKDSDNFGKLSNQNSGQNKFYNKESNEQRKYSNFKQSRVDKSDNFGSMSNQASGQFSSRQSKNFIPKSRSRDEAKGQFHNRNNIDLLQKLSDGGSAESLKFLAEAENLVKNYLNSKNRTNDLKSFSDKISSSEKNFYNSNNETQTHRVEKKENETKFFGQFRSESVKTRRENKSESEMFSRNNTDEASSYNPKKSNYFKNSLSNTLSYSAPQKFKTNERFNSVMPVEKKILDGEEEGEENIFEEKISSDWDQKLLKSDAESKTVAIGDPNLQKLKEKNLNDSLVSFMDVCVYSNNLDAAYRRLMNERQMSLKFQYLKIQDVGIYNNLLHGYSEKGNWGKVEEIFNWIKQDGLELNSQSYAAVFDCLARMRNENNNNFINEVAKDYIGSFEGQGYNLSDLFHKTQLVRDQREKILSAVRVVYPDYVVPKMEFQRNSDCVLLEHLNQVCEPYKTQRPEEITPELLKEFIEEQLQNESGMIFKVKAIHKPAVDYHEQVEELFEKWRSDLRDSFIKSVKMLKYEKNRSAELSVYLTCLPAETFVECMLYEIKRTVSEFLDPPTYVSTKILGTKVCQRYLLKKKEATGELDKLVDLYKKYTGWYLNPHGPAVNGRQYWQMLLENHPEGPHIDITQKKWPYKILKEVGNFLYQIVIKEIKIDLNLIHKNQKESRLVPVFYTQLQEENFKLEEIIKVHPIMQKIFQACNADSLVFDNDQIPMVCPPVPWSHINSGGYLLQKTNYTRPVGGAFSKPFEYTKIPQTQLYPTFDSLNQLQSIPWRINENMLDVALRVFQDGGSEELNVPSLPDLKPPQVTIDKDMSKQAVQKIMKQRKKAALEKVNEYGLWCEALYKLSLADHFRKKMIWLPQNMDFRGRVYPVPPHITHLGADLYRSLFLFAKGKELGPKGLDWLKIHTINLTGTHKKKSIQERLDYANEILLEILDSAERPLDGNRWWVKSDEQWQTLAACMEIKKALDTPNPEKYICRFPVHQDGSCNGLQHYAALGRDVIGAESVNLTPSEVPQDVYSVVVGIVERKRKVDQESGVKIAQILDGFINRRVIKQTIMTTVYGVTSYGAKLQIIRQLEDIKEFPQEHKQWAAAYLTQKTFESLNEMFTSARDIQHWFVNCAGLITSVKKDYVKWVTPVGLPVEQPYGKKIAPRGKKGGQSFLVPNTMKQKNAFPPNFVHSLDSSHMMLTSLHCEQAGITFASIHDCFWTHPSSVEVMNKICREQFISLHSQPILENLSQYFLETYKGLPKDKENIFLNIPPRGEFDLNSVLNSLYFFS